jgi:hypothetical protein
MNPDSDIREPAEKFIHATEKKEGYCRSLVEISIEETLPAEIKLAAAV